MVTQSYNQIQAERQMAMWICRETVLKYPGILNIDLTSVPILWIHHCLKIKTTLSFHCLNIKYPFIVSCSISITGIVGI